MYIIAFMYLPFSQFIKFIKSRKFGKGRLANDMNVVTVILLSTGEYKVAKDLVDLINGNEINDKEFFKEYLIMVENNLKYLSWFKLKQIELFLNDMNKWFECLKSEV